MALIYGDNRDHHKPYANAKPNAIPPDPGYWTPADASADYLVGTDERDIIEGGLLADTLIGGTDYLDGGDGNDMMFGTDGSFFGPPGQVTMVGGKGNDNYRDFLLDLDTALELSGEGNDWLMLHVSGPSDSCNLCRECMSGRQLKSAGKTKRPVDAEGV